MDVTLDLVVDLCILTRLVVRTGAVGMGLDLDLLFVALLVRHCSSF
jgi:hypothetical protein